MVQGLASRFSDTAHGVLDWFYPPHCYHCDVPLIGTGSRVLCPKCDRELANERIYGPVCSTCGLPFLEGADAEGLCVNCRAQPPHFGRARSLFPYTGPAGDIVKCFKFHGEFYLGPMLLRRAIESGWMPKDLDGFEAVVPVPLHPRRERERGYNQSELLGRVMARHAGVPLKPKALRRTRYTEQQAQLPALRRWENVRGAFEAGRDTIAGLHVLLLDDVMTTGATASECARILKKAGARQVSVLTLVRTTT
jgi:ComF family protein